MFGFFKQPPAEFVGHVLDPMRGYYTSVITPERASDAEKLKTMADGNSLYIIVHYEDGEPHQTFVHASQKAGWLKLKASSF